ncbi:adenine deaminase [Ancylomarina euxinus]|uniref:Adenine deaminase n=1 Tax=Ancylomarina euxinus TaxID=2283627 RepID=A0A425Y7Q7_9BACT|nr:adenine deaminase [Ancylomarina euxinus]MCZ4693628.1 adenine deaminase [Ancylomarina euxinus]MUP13856.1 adenine deaminase [Ancylomarina euxinus]RRG24513.1 adenine deaminase [Ancylomarina euxinus]
MAESNFTIAGNIVDVVSRKIFKGELEIRDGLIHSINELEDAPDCYILPGLVDSHVHIESSLLIPSRFADLVVRKGTLGIVTDPHEIANVLGEIGIDFMINDAAKTPLEIRFGVPSCVPATPFETSGFKLGPNKVESLLKREEVVCLAEVMDYPGVIRGDLDVMKKIVATKRLGKKIDGHAPGVNGEDLRKYVAAGVSADHECSTLEEALNKIHLGMMIQIREGSAAKDFEALYSLIETHSDRVMLCTDDTHPDDLFEKGHMDNLIRMGLGKGCDIINLLRAGSYNAIKHYGLDLGLLQVRDSADFIVIDSFDSFQVKSSYMKGECIYKEGEVFFDSHNEILLNNFYRKEIELEDIQLEARDCDVHVMTVNYGDLLTGWINGRPKTENGKFVSDTEQDLLKIVVMSRYSNDKPVVGFAKGFAFKKGAISGSIAHDSHNIIAVGTNDADLLKALNKLIVMKGGMVACEHDECQSVQLDVAGLMSNKRGEDLLENYKDLSDFTKSFGSDFHSPFMTLAFMSLLVIPKLKLSDKGLFDVEQFKLIDLYCE